MRPGRHSHALARSALARVADRAAGRLIFWRSAIDGVAAVEFALILPVMLTMLLGMSEVTLGVNIDRKLTLLSRSLADLSSRSATPTVSEMSNIFTAASVIMQPYDTSALKMVVTRMMVTQPTANGPFVGNVNWSCPRGTGAVAKPSNVTYTVPTGFRTKDSYYMLVEVAMPYTPMFGRAITGTVNLAISTPWPIRGNATATDPSPC